MARGPGATVSAIVVGHTDYGDSDRIVRLLCPEHGRLSVLARGARGSRKRFAGAFDLGNRVELLIRQGNGTLWHCDEATLLEGRVSLHTDLDRLSLLAYLCELAAALAREHHAEPRLFGLLDTAITLLDGMTGAPGSAWRVGFEAKALTFAGLAPSLDRCTACGLPPEAPMIFDPGAGGAVHQHCGGAGGHLISLDWLAAVGRARKSPLRDLLDLDLPPGPPWALAESVEAWQGRALRARSVLDAISAGA